MSGAANRYALKSMQLLCSHRNSSLTPLYPIVFFDYYSVNHFVLVDKTFTIT